MMLQAFRPPTLLKLFYRTPPVAACGILNLFQSQMEELIQYHLS